MDGSAYSNLKYDNSKPYNDEACCGEAKAALPDDSWQGRSVGMRCKTCVWFVQKGSLYSDARGPIGRCRRHCPTMGGFPVVFSQDWCGDHRLDENKV